MKRNWKKVLADMLDTKTKSKATALLEINDANDEMMTFPDISDVGEIAADVSVTATDGTHVFTADGNVITLVVTGGKVVSVDKVEETVSDATAEFIEAVAEQLDVNEQFRATALAEIDGLKKTISEMKALMSHGSDQGDKLKVKDVVVGGKKIDLTKVNFK